ncbi:Ubiquitin fusion degradation protein 4 [Ascosphaera aggregata]|nr:Ubiquitin fusion degradation protein 4 [Ascosphaera aggregata]
MEDDEGGAAVADAPNVSGGSSTKIDSVHIMQTLIHLPREQVYETLNVICEILPRTPDDAYWENIHRMVKTTAGFETKNIRNKHRKHDTSRKNPLADPRIKSRVDLLKSLSNEVKRFARILFPTLTDTYSSTVNQSVREKVLIAQMKMLLYLDASVLDAALLNVSYSSFLAAIFTQAQCILNPAETGKSSNLSATLTYGFGVSATAYLIPVKYALQCAILLFKRLPNVYIYQFQREGVVAQVERIAKWEMSVERKKAEKEEKSAGGRSDKAHTKSDAGTEDDEDAPQGVDEEYGNEGEVYEDDDEDYSVVSSDLSDEDYRDLLSIHNEQYQDQVIVAAREFLTIYKQSCSKQVHSQAVQVLETLKSLADALRSWYLDPNKKQPMTQLADRQSYGITLFKQLAEYFSDDGKSENITSAELLESGIVNVLLDVLGKRCSSSAASARYAPDATDAQADFLSAFMRLSDDKTSGRSTAFTVLTQKLHDLLSRTESFEVITTGGSSSSFSSSSGGNGAASDVSYSRSSAITMLAKQMRLRLVADDAENSGSRECPPIPKHYRNLVVSIHAISSFRTLDDYLRPRLILSDKTRGPQPTNGLASGSSAGGTPALTSTGGGGLTHQRHHHRHGGYQYTRSHADATRWGDEETSTSRRRTTRRHHQDAPPPPPELSHDDNSAEDDEEQLECADEKRLPENEDGDRDESRPDSVQDEEDEDYDDEDDGLDALVDDFEGDMSDDAMPPRDPSAVNVEVGSSGTVTAKREDGTKVPTPRTSTPAAASRPTAAQPPNAMPGAESSGSAAAESLLGSMFGSRSFASYAAALASIPQDWHLEFKMNGKILKGETTIYRAVHQAQQAQGGRDKNVFEEVHTVHFRRAPGPSRPEPSTLLEEETLEERARETDETGMPQSLKQNHIVASILKLLRTLHSMNSQLADIQTESNIAVRLDPEALTQFINTKLTAKLNRQLEEPLIVASGCLPDWSEDLARQFPFLFPFETRHMFLRSTSFGYARALMRWQQADDSRRDSRHDNSPVLGRLARQKVRISRSRILESAHKVMDLYGSSANVLEVEYFEEVGTGLGPTLEFYSTVSREFSAKKLKMWREHDSDPSSDYVFSKCGLFPAPMSLKDAKGGGLNNQLEGFKVLGKFIARSMLDSRIVDVPFSSTFFRLANQSASFIPTIGTVKSIDPPLANSLLYIKNFANAKARIEQDPTLDNAAKDQALKEVVIDDARIEDLGLDFTLPGYPNIELVPNGSNIPLTLDNVALYLERVIDLTLGSGVSAQLRAFRSGFSEVFPYSAMQSFTPDELVMLFGRIEEDWSIETLTDSMKADHGFNMDSKSVRNLLQVMSEFTPQQRRDFLQFVTGSPKLPIGGFKSLTPIFTVVCRPSEPPYTPDDYLPSVMTCVNYLKLPDYSSIEVLAERLNVAMSEGQGAFHLS